MRKSVQPYNNKNNRNVPALRRATSSAVEYLDQGVAYVELKMFEANIEGRIWQLEADALLVHKYKLPPRKNRL